ncbi:MAG: 50S ribosomal protein L28 [Dissulfurimicrobium sp.]|uniref:50S ribosomal protein L28 n=1 Tax=Dissulfurimicrobium sp. TaxID=2022436 RepID=UPI00404A994C
MSKVCEICGKRPQTGCKVSHANNHTHRRWFPNLQRVKAVVNGQPRHLRVCTQCIRSGLIIKPNI